MTEARKTLETLLEDAARARRFAIVLHGDPAGLELERYADELEAEIYRRARAPGLCDTEAARLAAEQATAAAGS